MKRIFPLACAALILAACSGARHSTSSLTLMSWNVGALGKFSENSAAQVSDMVKGYGADIVGLCELDSCTLRSNGVNQLEELTGLFGKGWKGVFGRALAFGGGQYGVGVASRCRIVSSFLIPLPKLDGSEPRACQVVETPQCWFAVTHLDFTEGEARMRQAMIVSSALKDRCKGKPVFLTGDFNSEPDSEVIGFLRRDWEMLSPALPSYPSTDARVCIDYIFVLKGSADYELLNSEIVSECPYTDVTTASDHLPAVVTLKLK